MPLPPNTGRDPLYRPADGLAAMSSLATATANRIAGQRNDESWVEVASQPSSSSVSSIADEIVITGLRVGSSANGAGENTGAPYPQRRRRLLQQVEAATVNPPAPSSLAGSSQEEYDETESEEDRDMTAPGPRLAAAPAANAAAARPARRASDGDDEDEDDDDNGTALGVPSFRPQPNAFSHPPTHIQQHLFLEQHQQHQQHQHRSVPMPPHQHIAPPYARSMSSRSAPSSHRPGRNAAPGFMASAYREDNEAALRASLSTLLSCAAAARGLPKKEGGDISAYAGAAGSTEQSPATAAGLLRPGNQPMGLRLVPESELLGGDGNGNGTPARAIGTAAGISPRTRAAPFQRAASGPSRSKPAEPGHHHQSSRNSAVSAVSTSSKTKRSGGKSSSSSPRVTKKKRTSSATDDTGGIAFMSLSPTLLTWVVSAGVVVLVSVVGFGAGFVIGREVGRQEAGSTILDAASVSNAASSAASSNATSCGREIMRSSTGSTLRRFRWGAMTSSVSA